MRDTAGNDGKFRNSTHLVEPGAGEFSIAVVPDTQIYTCYHPEVFREMTRWIVRNRERFNIRAVLHLGDVVDGNTPDQWASADGAWKTIDKAGIPYLLAIGNHDYDTMAPADRSSNAWNRFLPQTRYTDHKWWNGGFFNPDQSENAFFLLDIQGQEYIFLSLEFGPRDSVLAWANGLLDIHAGKTAVIVTHSYLTHDGTRVTTGSEHNPKDYALGATANDGEDMWRKLISRHANIRLVIGGHHINGLSNAAVKTDIVNGRIIHQIFANWQYVDWDNPKGWLQLLTFTPGEIRVQTYGVMAKECLLGEAYRCLLVTEPVVE